MIPDWQDFLASRGARIDAGCVTDFGAANEELAEATHATILTDLSPLGLLAFRGEDTASFLQGQLTNDIRVLETDGAQLSAYCSPKGRMLGNFLLWRDGEDICLQCSGDIRDMLLKRLKMFIMRSKLVARDASEERVRLLIAGAQAHEAVQSALGVLPAGPMRCLSAGNCRIIRLAADACVLTLPPADAPTLWAALAAQAREVGTPVWDWLRIRHGIPMITQPTVEAFVPHMVNYEAIDGVSFKKGCYPGQEIVARTQYLGKTKRRMFLAHLDAASTPAAGDPLYTADPEHQTSGQIVNAAAAPAGGYDLLAVLPLDSAQHQTIHWQSPDGPQLTLLPLPYALP
jgi:folate-binding protein YgfZ